jgi:uncharacterized membrane protein HdeD (DUF308 family)
MSSASTPLPALAAKSINWSIALSILLILAGLFAIFIPHIAGIGITLFLGYAMFLFGIIHLIFAFKTHTAGSVLWEVLIGLAYIFAGGYLFWHPLLGLLSLTLLLAVYLVIAGIVEFIHAFKIRPREGSGWLIVDGIVTLLLAFMIWRSWPYSSVWAIGTLIGVSMLFSGFSRLMLALSAKKLLNRLA